MESSLISYSQQLEDLLFKARRILSQWVDQMCVFVVWFAPYEKLKLLFIQSKAKVLAPAFFFRVACFRKRCFVQLNAWQMIWISDNVTFFFFSYRTLCSVSYPGFHSLFCIREIEAERRKGETQPNVDLLSFHSIMIVHQLSCTLSFHCSFRDTCGSIALWIKVVVKEHSAHEVLVNL